MGDDRNWLKGEELCKIMLWDGKPLAVTAPIFAILKVTETDPGAAWRHRHRRQQARQARDRRHGDACRCSSTRAS